MANALKKAGLDNKDENNRDVIHVHSLRKFFFTQMLQPLGRDVAEALMGHKLFLDAAYQRYTLEDVGKFYLKGMNAVTIMSAPTEVDRTEVEAMLELTRYTSAVDFANLNRQFPWSPDETVGMVQDEIGEVLSVKDKVALFSAIRKAAAGIRDYTVIKFEKTDSPRLNRMLSFIEKKVGEKVLDDEASWRTSTPKSTVKGGGNISKRVEEEESVKDSLPKKEARQASKDLTRQDNHAQKIVSENELGKHLTDGWEVVTTLHSGSVVIRPP